MNVAANVKITGNVQGVFFRASARDMAQSLGLTGWVRNLPDGRVEAMFEGDEERVKKAFEWCRKGPAGSSVENADVKYLPYTGSFKSFKIEY
ncbi:MAG: acylphosphatase [Candidatus Altiarchaeales archaeon IMC4]|nr:MAG: acylphosphatase [Candidatus Altiarchaeales archaeon IMC4]